MKRFSSFCLALIFILLPGIAFASQQDPDQDAVDYYVREACLASH